MYFKGRNIRFMPILAGRSTFNLSRCALSPWSLPFLFYSLSVFFGRPLLLPDIHLYSVPLSLGLLCRRRMKNSINSASKLAQFVMVARSDVFRHYISVRNTHILHKTSTLRSLPSKTPTALPSAAAVFVRWSCQLGVDARLCDVRFRCAIIQLIWRV